MNGEPNFLIGYGERLTEHVEVDRGGQTPTPPYTFGEARARVAPMVQKTADDLSRLPVKACPDDYAVGILTLHPQYTAKSYFPSQLLNAAKMQPIGSRPNRVVAEKLRNQESMEQETVELFVSARRRDFAEFAQALPNWNESTNGAKELFEVETIRAATTEDRVIKPQSKAKEPLLEVVLHTDAQLRTARILEAFEGYVAEFGLKPDFDRRFEVGGLCFVPLRAPKSLVNQVGQFSFLRVAREMPHLRQLRPMFRSTTKISFPCSLPKTAPVDPQLRAAVFDGGVPKEKALRPFVTAHEHPSLKARSQEGIEHGIAVTSALLFGPIAKKSNLPQPFGAVDHFRVIDVDSGTNDYELYDVLFRIQSELLQRRYGFVNLSVGPQLPIEAHEVHAWTAVLDDIIGGSDSVLTVAVGNDGDRDWDAGLARVQVPSDMVNAVAVGATDTCGKVWRRAAYSCIGPGRSPGRIKPDIVDFGGAESEPFYALDPTLNSASPMLGTSFASPYALRKAMGIRAHFGPVLSSLALKALLIHCAEPHTSLEKREIGWGRMPGEIEAFVTCDSGVARVVYQGELPPGQFLRTPIPLPKKLAGGNVTIRATFCIASPVDPQDPSNYTRSGLDITFRPHADKLGEAGVHAKTGSFFRQTDYDSENELRRNAHKWETVLHGEKRLRATSLKDPVFDVRYQTRLAGRPSRPGDKIKYALIITVTVPKMPDLYDKIVQRYQTQLEPLRPVIKIPVRT